MVTGAKSVLLIFIDGIGIGSCDPATNPSAGFEPSILGLSYRNLGLLPQDGVCLLTDAGLGVPGLPQSATGQTTLFTGINAARRLGRHLQGYPSPELRRLTAKESIFRKLKVLGLEVTFANSFTPQFFEKRPRWVSTTTVMCETAGVPRWRIDAPDEGRSLFMDFTNQLLREKGFQLPLRTPEEAARILVNLSAQYDFCL